MIPRDAICRPSDQPGRAEVPPLLTKRQLLVVTRLAFGRRPSEIAVELGIERDTVYEHLEDARKELQARTNCELVRLAACLGLFGVSDPWPPMQGVVRSGDESYCVVRSDSRR